MMYSLPYKAKQFFFVPIKLSIVIAAIYFIYYRLTHNNNLRIATFYTFLIENDVFTIKNAVFLIFLSSFNWFFEILKWQTLILTIKKISLKNATEQSLGALTASLFTPNRIGEYGAKAMYYLPKYRKRILLINLLHNMLQMVVTVIFGSIGLYIFTKTYHIRMEFDTFYKWLLLTSIILVFILIIFTKSNFKLKGFSLQKIKLFFLSIPKNKLILGGIFSLVRYLIFSFQFYVLLVIFKVDIDYLNAMIFITSMYLIASIIPVIFVFDVVIKGSVAVYLFSFLGVNELTILSIITLMWLLNFVWPSLIGSFFVLRFNIPKEALS